MKVEFKTLAPLLEAGKKLKKILSVLKDRRVVRFSMSMKLYRDDWSEPKTFSIEGERAADGGWHTNSPRRQNSGALQSLEILKEKLAGIEASVRNYIVAYALDSQWREIELKVRAALKSGHSTESMEYQTEIPIRAIDARSYDAHFCAPVMAMAYIIEGGGALEKGDLDHASYCVHQGLYWSSPDMLIPNPGERFSERASTGGRAKDHGREPVKNKVAELLIELQPEGGWQSLGEAIGDVTEKMIDNHSTLVEESWLQPDNLPRTIRAWIKAEPEKFQYRIKRKA